MMELRPAALSEFALLPAIEADADLAFDTLEQPLPTADFPPPGTAADFAAAFHIMVAGRPPFGFARLEIVDGQAHLEQLAVSADHSRRGVGRALVTAAKAWAHEAGFHSMTLTTFAAIPFNGPFYASCGFQDLPLAECGPELRARRSVEVALGLDDMAVRIAMKTELAGSHSLLAQPHPSQLNHDEKDVPTFKE